jgi:hypothetical protein
MQIRGLAGAALDRLLDEGQRVVETGVELRRHDVVAQRRFGMRHAIGELEDEVALMDLLRDADQVPDECHSCPPIKPASFQPLDATAAPQSEGDSV